VAELAQILAGISEPILGFFSKHQSGESVETLCPFHPNTSATLTMKNRDCDKQDQPGKLDPKPTQDPCDPPGDDACEEHCSVSDSESVDKKLDEIQTLIAARTQEKAALMALKTKLTANETAAETARTTYLGKYHGWKHYFECECSCAKKRVDCEQQRLGDKADEIIECLGHVKCDNKPEPCEPFDCDDFPPCEDEACPEKRRVISQMRLAMANFNVCLAERSLKWVTGLSARLEAHRTAVDAIKKTDDSAEDEKDDCDLPGLRGFIIAKLLECHACQCVPTPCKYEEEIHEATDALSKAYCRQLKETNRYNEAGGDQPANGTSAQQPAGGTTSTAPKTAPATGSAAGTGAGTATTPPAYDPTADVTCLIRKVRDCIREKRKGEPCEPCEDDETPPQDHQQGEPGQHSPKTYKPPGSK
jgi:hypothetical protein